MYQNRLSRDRSQNFVPVYILMFIFILALLAGCNPVVDPANQAPKSPISPLDKPVDGASQVLRDRAAALLANLPPDSPDDMSRLLAHAEPFECETDSDNVLHCAANAPAIDNGFAARVYVKVPDQGYPTDVVLLPIFPPGIDAEVEREPDDIRALFKEEFILNKADNETDFRPAWLITNFAVVKVDEDGVFSGKAEDALSEFDPAIEVRLEFNREQLQQAADAGLDMPRFGYWSYAPVPENRKWVEFTAEREYDNRALLEIFKADKGLTAAERGMADVGILEYIEEAETVDQALELLKQPSTRGAGEDAIRAIVIRNPTGLADKFDQFSNAFTRGVGTAETRISFVVTVSSWEDQALGGFP